MKNKIMLWTTFLVLCVIVLMGCADAQPDITRCLTGHVYGFWGGLWHGVIIPFSFLGSLFSDDIVVWAVNNNGGWYAFGFTFGAVAMFSSTSTASTLRKNKNRKN